MKKHDVELIFNALLKENKARKVHLTLSNQRFYNGFAISMEDDETLSFQDDILGYIIILYQLITSIEPFTDKKW